MISTGDIRKGIVIELDGQPVRVLEWTHIKMARGSAQVRLKIQNVRTGSTSWSARSRPGRAGRAAGSSSARSSTCTATATAYNFMDCETYDQFAISANQIGDDAQASSRRGPRSS